MKELDPTGLRGMGWIKSGQRCSFCSTTGGCRMDISSLTGDVQLAALSQVIEVG